MELKRSFRRLLSASLLLAMPACPPVAAGEPNAAASAHWVDGYYVGYERSLYPIGKIDFSSLSHIMVGRYVPNNNGTLDKSCDWDASKCPAWAKSVGAAAHKAGRKAILFLGGAGAHDGFAAAAKPGVRATLVKSVWAAVDSLGFDGVDIDWEPVNPGDVTDLLALLKDLRAARPHMLITMPVDFTNINLGTADIKWAKTAAQYLNQINIMTYEMDGSDWGWKTTWFTSALSGATSVTPTSVKSSVDAYLSLGIPAAKLGIGMGFYGQCWVGGVAGPRQPQGSSSINAADGDMSFARIMASYYSASRYHFDSTAGAPYLGSNTGMGPNKCTYISYEDEKSISAKASYVKTNGLGGAIIWTISQGWQASAGKNSVLKAAGAILK
jgi:chitinase